MAEHFVLFFKKLGIKRLIFVILGLFFILLITLSFFQKREINAFFDVRPLALNYEEARTTEVFTAPLYSSIRQQYLIENIPKTNDVRAIPTFDMQGQFIDENDSRFGNDVLDYHAYSGLNQDVLLMNRNHSLTFVNPNVEAGLYYLAIDYLQTDQAIDNTQIGIRINNEIPFHESQTIVLPSLWQFTSDEFKLDRYFNEIQPRSEKINAWRTHRIHDYRGMHPGLFAFYMEANDVVEIFSVHGELLIGSIHFVLDDDLLTYEQYLNQHGDHELINDKLVVSARDMFTRNDPSIRLRTEQDPSNLYYDTQFLRLNVIFGDSWQNSGQSITYHIEAEESGYYYLSFKYRQYMIRDMPIFRKIYINGEVPFDQLNHYAFPYTTSFVHRTLQDEDERPFKIFLKQGINTIQLEAVNYPYRQTIETIQHVMREIQSLALSIKRYTSGGTDRFRDWDIEVFFPNAADDIRSWADLLDETYHRLLFLATTDEPTELGNLRVASSRLRSIAEDVNRLPSRMVQFSDGDSSVNQLLGNLSQNLIRSNMEMERLMFHGDVNIGRPNANVFVLLFEGVKRLVLSFINNPYSASERKEGELMVWVNHPRQYIEIMQTLIDQSYDGEMKVTLSQMPDQNKLILARASNQSPDVAIGVNHWIPYEFAIRDAALDLRRFSGYEDLVKNFTKGAMIPYVFEDGVFGLPGTQNFWVTYYRRDILNSIGITEIPQTWEEIIAILPLLQSYGMNYYVPLASFSGLKPFVATLPFIYQFGGDLYTADGMQTDINSEQTLEGIRLMSELFTLYNMPKFVGNFFNHFRYGMLPIGISDLSTYLLLQTAAVELDGLWGMDLHPGVFDETSGEIIRYAAVGGQSNMILSDTEYPDEAWQFMKWWMSTETQTDFAFNIQSTYGKAYFWNTANINAFSQIPMPQIYRDIILEQWEFGLEAPRIPGNYMVEREISNAWTRIVFNGANPRQALDEAVRISNREILYKMAEFGYTFQGEILKEYIVPSIHNIDRWLTEVDHD
jgi:ABC-type glycerol-3-phosphate transport system substrate-binding protein